MGELKLTYEDAISYIEGLEGLGAKLGLSRIETVLNFLGNPQDNLKVIHVAGTNGKGSACALISSVLISAGYKVGVYTSPHLECYNERYTLNNQMISDDDFAYWTEEVKKVCVKLQNENKIDSATVFETLTAIAFCYFNSKNVDYVVLEVGLGGRFDATNVIKNPLVSVITSISYDHMDYLGNTLGEIAFEKAGIIKKNCPTVLYRQNEIVYNTVRDIAKNRNSTFYCPLDSKIIVKEQNLSGTTFSVSNEFFSFDNLSLGLIGDYQIDNAVNALTVCWVLKNSGIKISDKNIYDGFKNVKWPGRMEIIDNNPLVIVDGAHNADGIDRLGQSLKKYFSGKNITLLIGILKDKEYRLMLDEIIPLADKVIVTEPKSYRALDIKKMFELVKETKKEVYSEKNIEDAFKLAKSITEKDGVVCCAGSLYLIGEIKKIYSKFRGDCND